MHYFHQNSAYSKRSSIGIYLCLCASLLLGWLYTRAIEGLLSAQHFTASAVPAIPVVFRAEDNLLPFALKKGGLSALTPIELTPLSKLFPPIGQHLGLHSANAQFINRLVTSPNKKRRVLLFTRSGHKTKISVNTSVNAQKEVINVKPGGYILVLALLVDSDGVITRIKVLVPSRFPLMDLNYTIWMLGARIGKPDPPIAPGHARWVTLQLKYRNLHPQVKLP